MALTVFEAAKVFPVTVVQTQEPLRAVREMGLVWTSKKDPNVRPTVFVWDILNGVRVFDDWNNGKQSVGAGGPAAIAGAAGDPQAPIKKLDGTTPDPKRSTVVIALHHHLVWKGGGPGPQAAQMLQALLDGCRTWSGDNRRLVIVTPPGVEVPEEIKRYVAVVDFDLPTVKELSAVVQAQAEASGLTLTEDEVQALAELGRGLTTFEFTNALVISISLHKEIRRETVADQKAQIIRQSRALEWLRSPLTFADIGGLENVKRFLRQTAGKPLSRGVLLLGIPGVGKSMLAKALANELGWQALQLNMSQVFGSLVGESEQAIASALRIVDAMGKTVLMIDEIEKGLAGSKSSGTTDGGTTQRTTSSFLTWLSDRPAGQCFVIATCNDIDSLPAEYTRAERWDAVFFFDLPTDNEREIIAQMYAGKYGVALEPRPDEPGWTGAEIASAYRIAAMMEHADCAEAKRYVSPLIRTMEATIIDLRSRYARRCVPASDPDDVAEIGTEALRSVAAL